MIGYIRLIILNQHDFVINLWNIFSRILKLVTVCMGVYILHYIYKGIGSVSEFHLLLFV